MLGLFSWRIQVHLCNKQPQQWSFVCVEEKLTKMEMDPCSLDLNIAIIVQMQSLETAFLDARCKMLFILFCITQMKCCKRITHNYGHSWGGIAKSLKIHHYYSSLLHSRLHYHCQMHSHTHTCLQFLLTLPVQVTWPSTAAKKTRFTVTLIKHISLGGDLHSSNHWWQCWHWWSCSKISFACSVKHLCLQAESTHTHKNM